MNARVLVGARVLLPGGWSDDAAVTIADGRITGIGTPAAPDSERIDLAGHLLVPGFIDTQVNGGGGMLFNDAPTVETITTIAAAHRAFGTTALLPTLISDDLAVVAQALAVVDAAIDAGIPGVRGVHVEGPFLNPLRKGIHSAAKLRRLDPAAIELLTRPRRGRVLVTLAPELASPDEIAALVRAGVIVAAGHSDATYEEARRGLDAGITGFTHLFNAMSPFTSRAPGMVGAALEDRASIAGIIVDGHHVHPASLRVALRAKGGGGLMLVSDAMPTTGSDTDRFLLDGRVIRLADGRLTDDAGTLAGSALSMIDAVRNATTMLGVSLAEAVAMASEVPARFLGLGHRTGAIAAGFDADLLALDDRLEVSRSWIGGREASH